MLDRELTSRVAEFLVAVPENRGFPKPEEPEITLECERLLVEAIQRACPLDVERIEGVRAMARLSDAYRLRTFAVRMAIHAVRSGEVSYLTSGLFGLVLDRDFIDWRDVLVACSIIDDCAARVGMSFDEEIASFLPVATETRRQLITGGYLSRDAGMRSVEVMGYKAAMGPAGLYYIPLR